MYAGVSTITNIVLYITYLFTYVDAVAIDIITAEPLLFKWQMYSMHFDGVECNVLYVIELMVLHSEE